jgi:hypothetical protein
MGRIVRSSSGRGVYAMPRGRSALFDGPAMPTAAHSETRSDFLVSPSMVLGSTSPISAEALMSTLGGGDNGMFSTSGSSRDA